MRYLLNSPVLTGYGEFRFEGPLSLQAARAFAARGAHSAIGHDGAAQFLTRCLGVEVRARRESVRMQPGDRAQLLPDVRREFAAIKVTTWACGVLAS